VKPIDPQSHIFNPNSSLLKTCIVFFPFGDPKVKPNFTQLAEISPFGTLNLGWPPSIGTSTQLNQSWTPCERWMKTTLWWPQPLDQKSAKATTTNWQHSVAVCPSILRIIIGISRRV